MALKLYRGFYGGYEPDYAVLAERKYAVIPTIQAPIITVLNADQGFGQIKGIVRLSGSPLSNFKILIFKKSTRSLLWEVKSDSDGSYKARNIAQGLECFVVAVDPSGELNARIKDSIVVR